MDTGLSAASSRDGQTAGAETPASRPAVLMKSRLFIVVSSWLVGPACASGRAGARCRFGLQRFAQLRLGNLAVAVLGQLGAEAIPLGRLERGDLGAAPAVQLVRGRRGARPQQIGRAS